MYHYTESGLDNIYLKNGYEKHETAYGSRTSIHNIDDLHRAIAEQIIKKQACITPKEFRFLRIELDLSQKAFGDLIEKPEAEVLSCERAYPIDVCAELAIKLKYNKSIGRDEEADLQALLQNLHLAIKKDAEIYELKLVLEMADNGWQCISSELLSYTIKIGTQYIDNNRYVKIFRPSFFCRNKAKKFKAHCELLRSLAIQVPVVTDTFKIQDLDVCLYQGLPGRDLGSLTEMEISAADIRRIVTVLNSLQRHGIYFRAFHTGNIIVSQDKIGLIDLDDCRAGWWNKLPFRKQSIRKKMIAKLYQKMPEALVAEFKQYI